MNIKSFAVGFDTMSAIIRATKSPVHSAQDAVQTVKTGVLNASEMVTSFFAGAKQAVKYHRGTCPKLTVDVRSNEEQ